MSLGVIRWRYLLSVEEKKKRKPTLLFRVKNKIKAETREARVETFDYWWACSTGGVSLRAHTGGTHSASQVETRCARGYFIGIGANCRIPFYNTSSYTIATLMPLCSFAPKFRKPAPCCEITYCLSRASARLRSSLGLLHLYLWKKSLIVMYKYIYIYRYVCLWIKQFPQFHTMSLQVLWRTRVLPPGQKNTRFEHRNGSCSLVNFLQLLDNFSAQRLSELLQQSQVPKVNRSQLQGTQ